MTYLRNAESVYEEQFPIMLWIAFSMVLWLRQKNELPVISSKGMPKIIVLDLQNEI